MPEYRLTLSYPVWFYITVDISEGYFISVWNIHVAGMGKTGVWWDYDGTQGHSGVGSCVWNLDKCPNLQQVSELIHHILWKSNSPCHVILFFLLSLSFLPSHFSFIDYLSYLFTLLTKVFAHAFFFLSLSLRCPFSWDLDGDRWGCPNNFTGTICQFHTEVQSISLKMDRNQFYYSLDWKKKNTNPILLSFLSLIDQWTLLTSNV